jgi:hypothetical protein
VVESGECGTIYIRLDMMLVPVRGVDHLHAVVDANAPVPDCKRFVLYQALMAESEVARLISQLGGVALHVSQLGIASAARIPTFSPQPCFASRKRSQHHLLSRHVPADIRTELQSQIRVVRVGLNGSVSVLLYYVRIQVV